MMGRPLLSLATQDVIQLQQSPLSAREPPLSPAVPPPPLLPGSAIRGECVMMTRSGTFHHPLGDSTAAIQLARGGWRGSEEAL